MRWEKRATVLSVIGWFGLLVLAPLNASGADVGLNFSIASVQFDYVYDPGPDDVIGTINIQDDDVNYSSTLALLYADLGADGAFGGNDDTDLDWANIDDPNLFDMEFDGNVYKNGTNDYQIKGTLKITDTVTTLASPSIEAHYESASVIAGPNFFTFTGYWGLSPVGTNDSLLLPVSQSIWTYKGDDDATPSSPDEDGTQGWVTIGDGDGYSPSDFAIGDFDASFSAFGAPWNDVDDFFSDNRSSSSMDTQVIIVPEPTMLMLALVCLGTAARRERRR